MDRWFRYFSSAHAKSFVEHGEILFRSLSYFRDYEDSGVRGDDLEGTLRHLPANGLTVKKLGEDDEIPIPFAFESSVNEDDIFVYCLGTELSAAIGAKFKANVCVEIVKPERLLARLRSALKLRPQFRQSSIVHGPVTYYAPESPPLGDWAIPDRIAFRKSIEFEWQREFRMAIPKGDAFSVYNVRTNLVGLGTSRPPRKAHHPSLTFKLGSLRSICRSHAL